MNATPSTLARLGAFLRALADAQIPPRRYSSLWSAFTGPGKPMRRTEVWELNDDKAGGNSGKPAFLREWVDL